MFRGTPQLLAIGARILSVCGATVGLLALACLVVPPANAAADRSQGRSMVISRGGIVAAESPLAAQAGATVLARGGNAIDAIVAANAVMGVVEPMMNGMGGDLFAIVYNARTGKLYGLNASGWAPRSSRSGFLSAKGITTMPEFGIDSVTVPGAVDGWSKLLARFGTRNSQTFSRPRSPMRDEASRWRNGMRDTGSDRRAPHCAPTPICRGPTSSTDLRPAWAKCSVIPDLARSLEQVARGGRDAFYKGAIAGKHCRSSHQLGGAMTAEDLADFSSEWVSRSPPPIAAGPSTSAAQRAGHRRA